MDVEIRTDGGDEIVLQKSPNDEKVNLTVGNRHHHLSKREALILSKSIQEWFQ